MSEASTSGPPIQQVLADKGMTAPTAADYALILDLRERIQTYLDEAAGVWFERYRASKPKLRMASGGWVSDFNEDEVTYEFYEHPEDADYNQSTAVLIPIGDLLPEYGRCREILRALKAVGRS